MPWLESLGLNVISLLLRLLQCYHPIGSSSDLKCQLLCYSYLSGILYQNCMRPRLPPNCGKWHPDIHNIGKGVVICSHHECLALKIVFELLCYSPIWGQEHDIYPNLGSKFQKLRNLYPKGVM